MIDRPARKVGDPGAGGGDPGLSILIREADDGVCVGDVKIVADQGDAEGRVEMVEKHGSQPGRAVSGLLHQRTQPVMMSLGR